MAQQKTTAATRAAPTPYHPDSLPEEFRGKDDRETINRMLDWHNMKFAPYQPAGLPEGFLGASNQETIDKLLENLNSAPPLEAPAYQPEGLRDDLCGSTNMETIDKLLGYVAGLVDGQKPVIVNSGVAAEKVPPPRQPVMLKNARVLLLATHLIGGVEFPRDKTLENYTGPKSRNMKVLPPLRKPADD